MRRKTIFLSAVLILLLLAGFGYFFFNGNPITKKESKEIVAEYLQTNYPGKSFTIDPVGYYPGEGTYIVHFISKDGKLQGNIDVTEGKVDENAEIELFDEGE